MPKPSGVWQAGWGPAEAVQEIAGDIEQLAGERRALYFVSAVAGAVLETNRYQSAGMNESEELEVIKTLAGYFVEVKESE